MHGAGTLAAKSKAARGRVEERCRSEAVRYAAQSVRRGLQASPIGALDEELRRSVALVRRLDEIVAALDESELVWGLARTDLVAAGVRAKDIPTILAQQHGRTHPAIDLLHREQAHLTKLISISLGPTVPTHQRTQRALDEHQIDMMEQTINACVRALGHNPGDVQVRRTVLAALRSL